MNPKQQEENNNKPSPLLSLKLRVCPPRASQEAHSTKQPYDQTQPDQSHPPAQFNGDAVSNGNTKSIRLVGPTPEDITTLHPDQSHWNIDNLPSVLYALRPGSQYVKSRARVRTTEFEIFGKHVREFHVLPRQISFKVEGWRVEAWWRLDRRIGAQDLLDRINPKFGITMLDLEMRREQFRRSFCVADWKSQSSINEVTRLVKMAGIDPRLNTTRGLTPGLIDPPRGEDGGRIPAPAGKEKFVDFSGSKPFFVISGLQQHAAPKPVSIPSSPNQRKAISSPLSERVQLPVYTLAPPLIQKRKTEDWTRPTSPLQKKKHSIPHKYQQHPDPTQKHSASWQVTRALPSSEKRDTKTAL